MKRELFNQIVKDIAKFQGLTRDCANLLINKYVNVSPNAIHSILSAEMMQKMKTCRNKLHGIRYNHYGNYEKARKDGERPGIIVRMAAKTNLPPALLARVILERHFQSTNKKFSRADISQLMKDTTRIQDVDLAYEIYLCVLYDDRNGLISDSLCLTIGNEYEEKLQYYLDECNASYSTEDDLRARGYDKTPDVKLEIPVAVDGFIINWIESKGRFGSPDIHKTHVKEQFLSYWNRFGSGLVIYWFGFVDDIVEPNEKKFIIMDHFPENIVHMNPTIPQL